MMPHAEVGPRQLVIEPYKGWGLPPAREVWAYRELL